VVERVALDICHRLNKPNAGLSGDGDAVSVAMLGAGTRALHGLDESVRHPVAPAGRVFLPPGGWPGLPGVPNLTDRGHGVRDAATMVRLRWLTKLTRRDRKARVGDRRRPHLIVFGHRNSAIHVMVMRALRRTALRRIAVQTTGKQPALRVGERAWAVRV